MENEQLDGKTQATALILANAADVAARVIARIAGNELSSSMATKEKLSMLLLGQMTRHLEKQSGV